MNNHFFSICNQNTNNGSTQNDKYNCCINTCTTYSTQPNTCYSLCAQTFPLIKDYCAFKMNCWNNGFFDPKCIQQHQQEIHNCCLNECGQYKYNTYTSDSLNCNQYCLNYVVHP